MTRGLGAWIAVALLAIAQGCSDGDDEPSGTCSPTTQTEADPDGVSAFCTSLYETVCHRGFTDCVAELDLTNDFASAAECTAELTAFCSFGFANYWYDAACGEACIAYAAGASCGAFNGPEPQACALAMGQLGPPPPPAAPACSATISPGTLTDTISASDPLYAGGHARAYCITFTAGQSVTIRTAAPTSGTAIGDTVVHLLAGDTAIASDDDGGDALYSLTTVTIPTTGEYRIVVRGYSSSYVGSYQLTVTTAG